MKLEIPKAQVIELVSRLKQGKTKWALDLAKTIEDQLKPKPMKPAEEDSVSQDTESLREMISRIKEKYLKLRQQDEEES